jgi:hypothetical protein
LLLGFGKQRAERFLSQQIGHRSTFSVAWG